MNNKKSRLPTLKDLLGVNYYELLEVKPSSFTAEIQQAYQKMKAIYKPEALAAYSLFSSTDLEKVNKRLDEAFALLTTPNKRKEYDASLAENEVISKHDIKGNEELEKQLYTLDDDSKLKENELIPPPGLIYDGKYLKELRQLKKISLDEIYKMTKIRIPILTAIENMDIKELPDVIYLKNFLKEYAKCLKLNPAEVAGSYIHVINKMKSSKGE